MSGSINFGHSPDADDAFMFHGFASGAVTIPGHAVEHTIRDIQTLNDLSIRAELDVTAISVAHYPEVSDKFRIMSAGASVGRNYGPVVVSKRAMTAEQLAECVVGCPGEHTTSWLLYRILGHLCREVKFINFDQLDAALEDGGVDAAIMLHERQITFQRDGLHEVVNLGRHWFDETGLPIPLGVDVINRRLAPDVMQAVADAFKTSIKHAQSNPDAALEYALQYGRGLDKADGHKFIGMYVNADTLEMPSDVEAALEEIFKRARAAGVIDRVPQLDILRARVQEGF